MAILRSFLPLVLLTSTALAQRAPASPWTEDVFTSLTLGEQRTLYIATPAGYATGSERYPVLVLLDADDRPQFTAAVANIAFLSSRNAIPPLIVVGVVNGKDRAHDLAPAASATERALFPTAGGAAAFTSFIIDEVLPRVRSTYRTIPVTLLAGHSFGGIFALHVAAANPGVFAGIVAMSPSLWWNDSTAAVGYADSIAKAPAPLRLFSTSGGLETPITVTAARFAARLDSIKPARLAFAHAYYPANTHGLTPVPSLMDGLRFVFEPVSLINPPVLLLGGSPDSATVMNAVVSTENAYAAGARTLGLAEHLPQTFMSTLAYAVLRQYKLPGVAVSLFRRNAATFPGSSNAFAGLGDGLLALGDSAGARAQFRHSIDVAARSNEPANPTTEAKLAALEHRATAKPQH